MRLQGASYEEIARAGGGIRSTVAATRAAHRRRAVRAAPRGAPRVLMAEGVTTLEIKSGYGLDLDDEARMLRVARRLGRELPLTVRTTCLAAHALPPEFERPRRCLHRRRLRMVAARCRPRAWSMPSTRFCDRIGFTRRADAARVRGRASARPAGQAARRAAERPGRRGARRELRRAVLRSPRARERGRRAGDGRGRHRRGAAARRLLFPARDASCRRSQALRDAGVPIAIATDHNPGSVAGSFAAADDQHGLHAVSPDAGRGAARRDANAARALGLADRGVLAAGTARRLRRLGPRPCQRAGLLVRPQPVPAGRRGGGEER